MIYAQIENGIVINVIVATPDVIAEREGEWVDGANAVIGYAYKDNAFSPAVPQSVTPRQIRQALTQVGLRATIEASIAGGDQNAKDWYEYATQFERNHPIVLGMAQALSITEQQLDDLWRLAGSL